MGAFLRVVLLLGCFLGLGQLICTLFGALLLVGMGAFLGFKLLTGRLFGILTVAWVNIWGL